MVRQSENNSDQKVTLRGLRQAGFICERGGPTFLRKFCERLGIDWGALRRGEVTINEIEQTGHPVALKVARALREFGKQ